MMHTSQFKKIDPYLWSRVTYISKPSDHLILSNEEIMKTLIVWRRLSWDGISRIASTGSVWPHRKQMGSSRIWQTSSHHSWKPLERRRQRGEDADVPPGQEQTRGEMKSLEIKKERLELQEFDSHTNYLRWAIHAQKTKLPLFFLVRGKGTVKY